ncbi:MAG TPA: hypothetical protein VFU50_09545 [Terriglobales bacterium]|nr:hypothetical protein [Terriglobales bacterium]
MKRRSLMAVLTTLLLSTGMIFAQAGGNGNPHGQTSLPVPVTGTFTAPTSGALSSLSALGSGTMAGTFNINQFAVQNNAQGQPQLVAIGNLIATLTNSSGQSQTTVLNNVVAAVDPTGTCPILSLTLAPLHLDLLGLVVDIPNPVNLNIVAQSGPGNLLGNLLCDVTGLLNGGGALQTIANDLNQILAGLGL